MSKTDRKLKWEREAKQRRQQAERNLKPAQARNLPPLVNTGKRAVTRGQ